MPKCTNRTCRRAGVELSITQFYSQNDRKTGHCSWCNECMKLSSQKSAKMKGYKKDKRYDNDSFLQTAIEYNKNHPFVRSRDCVVKIAEMQGTATRTVVI